MAQISAHLEWQLAIERLRDSVIDLEIVVDDARRDVNAAEARLCESERARNAEVNRLLSAMRCASEVA